ncbi:hypothetical protein RP20_CCG019862 [Aedes albopictus]|nr:hypothetical protein RP20_CCG019862 [Aedes albopictus]
MKSIEKFIVYKIDCAKFAHGKTSQPDEKRRKILPSSNVTPARAHASRCWW